MKTNTTQQSLARKVAAKLVFLIVWLMIFPVVVLAGIIDKITNKHKVTANTSVISDKSKISPKNTNNSSKYGEAIGEEFNFPNLEEFEYKESENK